LLRKDYAVFAARRDADYRVKRERVRKRVDENMSIQMEIDRIMSRDKKVTYRGLMRMNLAWRLARPAPGPAPTQASQGSSDSTTTGLTDKQKKFVFELAERVLTSQELVALKAEAADAQKVGSLVNERLEYMGRLWNAAAQKKRCPVQVRTFLRGK